MSIATPLFEGQSICLAPIDHEQDPEIAAGWTQNAAYLRMLDPKPARPLSPGQVKKQFEALEKEIEESKNLFYFAIHTRPSPDHPERLIGFVKLHRIDWAHGTGFVQIGIGDPGDWDKGYGSDALRLILRFAFNELNLYWLAARVPEYNLAARALFHKAGFIEEVCRREALQRDGKRWAEIHMGLLAAEWRYEQVSRAASSASRERPRDSK